MSGHGDYFGRLWPVGAPWHSQTVPDLLNHLFGTGSDEKGLLSICAVPDPQGSEHWYMRHGSLLVVPEECATMSWAEWRRQESAGPWTELDQSLPPGFCLKGEGWLFSRAVLEVSEAETWMDDLVGRIENADGDGAIVLPKAGSTPTLSARLQRPDAMIRVLPGTDASAGSLVTGLKRPAQALLWPGSDPGALPEPQSVELAGQHLFNPSIDLAGIHLSHVDASAALSTPVGLLVGRAERRAWIRTARGSGDFEAFIVDLGWESAQFDPADLELTHTETLRGEMVSSTRIRLEDLDPLDPKAGGWLSLRVPTLGRKVAHELLLHTLDGELLDRTGPYPLIEQTHITPVVDGHRQPTIISGIKDAPPELDQRLERADKVATEVEKIIQGGVQARVIADRQAALERLGSYLKRAKGELLVRDRYFGQHVDEWRLLDDVDVPTRVLTAKIADEVPVIAPHVQARYRPKDRRSHERVYLWEGGGLSLGGSPSTFGQGSVRITRIRPAEIELWRAEFEALWASDLFREVPQLSP